MSAIDRSEKLDMLAKALTAAQAEFETVAKAAENPFFKSRYADLPTVVKAAAPVLAKHDLAVSQLPGCDDHGDTLTTMVLHGSGQYIAGTMRLRPVKNDPQAQGSAMTYARRYAYMATLGLVADADDDGNRATSNSVATPRAAATPAQNSERAATAKQRGLINARASEKGLDSQQLADVLLAAASQAPRTFDSPDLAQQFVNRNLDRLPGRLVDDVLAGIEQYEADEKVPF